MRRSIYTLHYDVDCKEGWGNEKAKNVIPPTLTVKADANH